MPVLAAVEELPEGGVLVAHAPLGGEVVRGERLDLLETHVAGIGDRGVPLERRLLLAEVAERMHHGLAVEDDRLRRRAAIGAGDRELVLPPRPVAVRRSAEDRVDRPVDRSHLQRRLATVLTPERHAVADVEIEPVGHEVGEPRARAVALHELDVLGRVGAGEQPNAALGPIRPLDLERFAQDARDRLAEDRGGRREPVERLSDPSGVVGPAPDVDVRAGLDRHVLEAIDESGAVRRDVLALDRRTNE
jgi:hypothetical protein